MTTSINKLVFDLLIFFLKYFKLCTHSHQIVLHVLRITKFPFQRICCLCCDELNGKMNNNLNKTKQQHTNLYLLKIKSHFIHIFVINCFLFLSLSMCVFFLRKKKIFFEANSIVYKIYSSHI